MNNLEPILFLLPILDSKYYLNNFFNRKYCVIELSIANTRFVAICIVFSDSPGVIMKW